MLVVVRCVFLYGALAPKLHVRVAFSRGTRGLPHHDIGGRTCHVVHGHAPAALRLEPDQNAYHALFCSAERSVCEVDPYISLELLDTNGGSEAEAENILSVVA